MDENRINSLVLSGQAETAQLEELGAERVESIKTGEQSVNLRNHVPDDYEVKQVGDRRFAFGFSNESPDQAGDIIQARGWDLAVFKQNPVILWAHDGTTRPPVGKGLNVKKGVDVGGSPGLAGEIEIAKEGTSEFTDTLLRFVEEGLVRATSVGFKILESKRMEPEEKVKLGMSPWGIFSTKQRLFEVSLVSVPMNSDALAREADGMLSKGLVTKAGVQELLKTMPLTERDYSAIVKDLCSTFIVPSFEIKDNTPPMTLGYTSGTTANEMCNWVTADVVTKDMLDKSEAREERLELLVDKQALVIERLSDTVFEQAKHRSNPSGPDTLSGHDNGHESLVDMDAVEQVVSKALDKVTQAIKEQ